MKESLCGANCLECPAIDKCSGCSETNGCPYGKQCSIAKSILVDGKEHYVLYKKKLIEELNSMDIAGMDKVIELYPLVGKFVNLEYELPNGDKVKFLKDDEMYLGTQVANLFDDGEKSCYGIIASEGFILVCKYGENCSNPQLVLYKRR